MEEGINTRFVVTNKPTNAENLYDHYLKRGETENRIKDLKVALKADRLNAPNKTAARVGEEAVWFRGGSEP